MQKLRFSKIALGLLSSCLFASSVVLAQPNQADKQPVDTRVELLSWHPFLSKQDCERYQGGERSLGQVQTGECPTRIGDPPARICDQVEVCVSAKLKKTQNRCIRHFEIYEENCREIICVPEQTVQFEAPIS